MPVAEDDREYPACTTEYGKYKFLRVTFGISVAPDYFALMIIETPKGLDFCFSYMDNIITYSMLCP